jgi:hypothetical protein
MTNDPFLSSAKSLLLSAHPSTVDDENVAVDVVAGGTRKEECGAGNVVGLAPTSGWNAFEYLAIAGFVCL